MQPCLYSYRQRQINQSDCEISGNCGKKLSRIKVLANEDTLLPTQMFPRLPAHATFWSEIFRVRNKCFPVCPTWKQCCLDSSTFRAYLFTSSMRKIPCWSAKMAENIPPLLSTQPLQEVQNVTRRVKHERSWKDEEIETLIGLYEERMANLRPLTLGLYFETLLSLFFS